MSLLNAAIEATETNQNSPINSYVAPVDVTHAKPGTDNASDVITTGKDYAGHNQRLFPVVAAPISGPYGVIDGKQGIFVNKRNINVVSSRYAVHQPSEILQTFENVAEKTGLEINRILPNEHNGGLLISAKFADTKILGEKHDINLTFYTSHCGKYKTFLTLDLLRVACFNAVPMLYRNKQRFIFAEKHYKNALNIELIGQSLEHIPESIEAYAEKAEILNEKKVNFDTLADIFATHYKMDKAAKQFDTKIEKLRNTYYNATGQRELADTMYKAYQAITFLNTHELRETKMKAENVLTKASNDSLVFLDLLLEA